MRFRDRFWMKLAWLAAFSRYDWREAAPIVARGLHSGIPTCCVTFFVFEWLPWARTSGARAHPYNEELERAGFGRVREEEQIRRWRAGEKPDETPPQYLPCPDCLAAARFVELHVCDASCAGKPGATVPRGSEERGEA